ncbi:MAG: hypothetical protein N3F64_04760 [Nitrososphaeria archaeon]|nr:hypothetical protein [Nitrososphaeria archaeon]
MIFWLDVLQVDVFALLIWSIIVVCIMSAVIVTYNIVKGVFELYARKPKPPSFIKEKEKEFFISIDVSEAISFYNQAQSYFEQGEYKNVVQCCYNAVKNVFTKILVHFNIPSEDLNIVDMSYIIQVKGVRVSFMEYVQHLNFIRLRMIVGQIVSKDEILWALKACRAIIDVSKELPVSI